MLIKELSALLWFSDGEHTRKRFPDLLPSMDEIYNQEEGLEEQEATPFQLIKQVPKVLGFAYTDKVCEVKMLHSGTTLT